MSTPAHPHNFSSKCLDRESKVCRYLPPCVLIFACCSLHVVGGFLTLQVTVCNNGDKSHLLGLQIQPYQVRHGALRSIGESYSTQEMFNGVQRVGLAHKLLWMGSLQCTIVINPQQTVRYSVKICALQKGVYYFLVKSSNSSREAVAVTCPSPLKLLIK